MSSNVPSTYITEILAGFLPIQKIGFCLYVMCSRLRTSVGLLLSFHPGNWLSPGLGINNLSSGIEFSQILITYPKPMWMVGIPPR
jgi:hypothetical protein